MILAFGRKSFFKIATYEISKEVNLNIFPSKSP
jgi:hypothetical protein